MCVTDCNYVTLAVKVALNLNTTTTMWQLGSHCAGECSEYSGLGHASHLFLFDIKVYKIRLKGF